MTADEPDATREIVDAAVAAWAAVPGGLLPVLQVVHEQLGWLPDTAVERVAQRLNRSRAEVHGVISFYSDLRREPPGRHRIQICQAESCQALGSAGLTRLAEAQTGTSLGGRSADGEYSLEAVHCLGLCACSPAVAVDGQPHGRVTPEALLSLLGRDA